MNTLENGWYEARFTGAASVYENSKQNLVVCFELDLGGVNLRYFGSLTKENGREINERIMNILQNIFPKWDGDTPAWFLEPNNIANVVAEAMVENQTKENGTTWSNIVDIRPKNWQELGNSMPKSMDVAAIKAKYGAKFRALARVKKA